MRVARVKIRNFRCLEELDLDVDDITVLVGANGTGKSSVLHALGWFFAGGHLDLDDVTGRQEGLVTSVSVTFRDFSDPDREALGSYVVGDEATFERSWQPGTEGKLTGHALAFQEFEAIRAHAGAQDRIDAYRSLRQARPDLGLPAATSGAAVLRAMDDWEGMHPDLLERASTSATNLFGWAGKPRLAGRFDFVLIPAVLDVEREATDARGTLLRQLLERTGGARSAVLERLQALGEETRQKIDEIMSEQGRSALDDLAEEVTQQLQRFVPEASVTLRSTPSGLDLSPTDVQLRIAEPGFETDVGRQGHGVQRSLLMALVQQLSATSSEDEEEAGGRGLLLLIEEPELYQHPLQAKHLASTLRRLGRAGGAPVQVAYATHSEHFVDATNFETLRRFSKTFNAAGHPTARVTAAKLDGVAERLEGVIPRTEIAVRIRINMRQHLEEAVFSRAAVVVEGPTDAAFLAGLADRRDGLDAAGIALVPAGGKTHLLLPWAILEELGVPTYLVFDGDADIRNRVLRDGKGDEEASAAAAKAEADNRRILAALGARADLSPESLVTDRFTMFSDELEAEFQGWTGFTEALEAARTSLEEFRGKSDDAYREAAAAAEHDPPVIFSELLDAILRLPEA